MDVLESAQATLEIIMMEEWMDDECKCESAHEGPVVGCTVEVAYKTSPACGYPGGNVCEGRKADWEIEVILHDSICIYCDAEGCYENWKFIPV